MLHRQSAVTFASSLSSGSASSRCLLGLRRRLSPLLSLLGWTASTACSSARLRASWRTPGRCSMLRRGSSATGGSTITSRLSFVMFSTGCIEYKLCLLVIQSLHGAAPDYLRDCCTVTHSFASGLRLRSLEWTDLRVRRMKTHFGDRAFSAAGPRCWNSLPPVIRFADSVDSFKAQLKTHIFAKAYPM